MKTKSFLVLLLPVLAGLPAIAQSTGGYFLAPDDVRVPPGDSVHLTIYKMTSDMATINDARLFTADWTLNGNPIPRQNPADGRLRVGMQAGTATYIAPKQVPKRNPVAVTIAFRPSDTSKTLLMYTCTITVVDMENYFTITKGDLCPGIHEFAPLPRGFMSTMNSAAVYLDGELHINIMGTEQSHPSNVLGIAVFVAGNSAGTYPWSITYDKNKGMIAPSNTISVNARSCQGGYVSTDVVPHGSGNSTPISLKGSTTITTYDRSKKLLQGYFAGQVLNNAGNGYHYAFVYGRFTVHLP